MDRKDAELEIALRQPEPAIGDDGFSDMFMTSLPGTKISNAAKRRWTLGGAAALGSVLTSVLGAPLETAFSSFVLEGAYGVTAIGVILLIGIIAVPVACAFYSR